jgi:hypothetical protein
VASLRSEGGGINGGVWDDRMGRRVGSGLGSGSYDERVPFSCSSSFQLLGSYSG